MFGLAGVIIQKALRDHPVQMPELKAAKLMRSPRERALINAFGAQRGWRCWSRTEPAVH
jgi:hypothetical protein